MATWKVVADRIKLFPHPTSERLRVGKVGKFQVVVNTDNPCADGDIVVFAPERSILPEAIRAEYVNTDTGESYLQGDNRDRVGAVRLRGELSEGATLPIDWVLKSLGLSSVNDLWLNVDLSDRLGITKYVPPVPADLVGKVSHMNEADFETRFVRHDVELFHMFKDEFVEGELVDLTEKVHGSQVNIMKSESGKLTLSSKYLGHEGMLIDEDPTNSYWQAVNNSGLREILGGTQWAGIAGATSATIQVVAELIPCHRKFGYGQTKPMLRIFKLIVNGVELPLSYVLGPDSPVGEAVQKLWVPFIARIPFEPSTFAQYANGMEQVSGKELHIREGVVITPVTPRNDSEGHGLAIKFLNEKFKGAPTDFA